MRKTILMVFAILLSCIPLSPAMASVDVFDGPAIASDLFVPLAAVAAVADMPSTAAHERTCIGTGEHQCSLSLDTAAHVPLGGAASVIAIAHQGPGDDDDPDPDA